MEDMARIQLKVEKREKEHKTEVFLKAALAMAAGAADREAGRQKVERHREKAGKAKVAASRVWCIISMTRTMVALFWAIHRV